MELKTTFILTLIGSFHLSWAQYNQTTLQTSYSDCNGVLITSAPFNADNTGNADSAGAFNAAISRASTLGTIIL